MIGTTVFYEKKKNPFAAKLSLVSLMDIFTILVFFLLLNSGEAEKIENAKFVELPDSTSGVTPHTELQIVISEKEILIGQKPLGEIAEVLGSNERVVEPLAAALQENAEQMGDLSAYEKSVGLAVTISADRTVPFALLEKVMSTCQHSGYRNISLAVNRVGGNIALDAPEPEPSAGSETSMTTGES